GRGLRDRASERLRHRERERDRPARAHPGLLLLRDGDREPGGRQDLRRLARAPGDQVPEGRLRRDRPLVGFAADRAIVTTQEVEAITHEGGLENLDTGSATLVALLPQATNAIVRELKKRGADPEYVTNVADFKEIAA